ncbi:MAG: c-type cytochrome [Planctomycetes bacterium]|nr:c-type cytochrome [Planctomycetota bacterium]
MALLLVAGGLAGALTMRRNKHLLLWSSLATLALLVTAAAQENVLRPWRRMQHAASVPIDVRLRQVVVPALGAADRCVSCHVGMATGEPTASGDPTLAPHPDVAHDPNTFGCTVCHGGQGRATDADDAHGWVHFWPAPMLPLRNADAGCGSCHTHLAVTHVERLREGQTLVERLDCLACHELDGRGGTTRPRSHVLDGPDLSRVGARGVPQHWYEEHLTQRTTNIDPAWATSFGPISESERATLEEFLASRVGAPKLVAAKSLFHSLGCRGCHRIGGVGGDDGPDLTLVGERDPGRTDFSHVRGEHTLANWFAEHFRAPATIVLGSRMPTLGLSEEEIELLTHYMLSLRRSDLPDAFWPTDRVRAERLGQREFATDGATLYGAFCAACHGTRGQGMRFAGMTPFPAVGSRDFLAIASDDFLRLTIEHGRPGRRMPAWGVMEGGLRPAEISAVIAHLRDLGEGTGCEPDGQPVRWAQGQVELGRTLFAQHCAPCHGKRGQGGEGLALANRALLAAATDTYLFESIRRGRRETTMPAFGASSAVRPTLSDREIESIVTFLRSFEVGP